MPSKSENPFETLFSTPGNTNRSQFLFSCVSILVGRFFLLSGVEPKIYLYCIHVTNIHRFTLNFFFQIRKPVIEKKRRDRINTSLEELKTILIKQPWYLAKVSHYNTDHESLVTTFIKPHLYPLVADRI